MEQTKAVLASGEPTTPICGACSDSRHTKSGDLFVAIEGERVDGHAFVAEAFERGAACALVRRVDETMLAAATKARTALVRAPDPIAALGVMGAYHRRRFDVEVIGVTGSTGKTTTKDLIASVLNRRHNVLWNEGNLNTQIGVPLTLLRLRKEHRIAVVEMGMRGLGEIAYLARLALPSMAVVTNVAEAHLELMGSLQNTARAKAELLDALPEEGLAVLNRDNPWVVRMGDVYRGRKLWYSLHDIAQVQASDIQSDGGRGMEFTLFLPDGSARAFVPLPGFHNVSNALAAAAVGHAFGLSVEQICEGLKDTSISAQRSEVSDMGGWTLIDDSYNASPASNRAALSVLKDISGDGRSVAVFGDMLELGAYSRLGHAEVGESARELGVDIIITVGELARGIGLSARERGHKSVHMLATNREAEELLKTIVKAGDTVLIKGSRGMLMEEIVSALKTFSHTNKNADATGY